MLRVLLNFKITYSPPLGGIKGLSGRRIKVKLPVSEVMWLEAPEFATQLVAAGGVKAMVLKNLANDG
jgi:hypothetical protein